MAGETSEEKLDAVQALHKLNRQYCDTFDLANSFAKRGLGHIAVTLHGVANELSLSMRLICGNYGLPMPQPIES